MAIRYTVTKHIGDGFPTTPAVTRFRDEEWERVDRELHGKEYDDYDWEDRTIRIVARDGRQIAGFASLYTAGGTCLLEELLVHPDYRRQGIGRTLVTRAEKLARQNKCHKIRLETDDGLKPAISLYKAVGFKKEASLPDEDGKRPTAVYGKRLH